MPAPTPYNFERTKEFQDEYREWLQNGIPEEHKSSMHRRERLRNHCGNSKFKLSIFDLCIIFLCFLRFERGNVTYSLQLKIDLANDTECLSCTKRGVVYPLEEGVRWTEMRPSPKKHYGNIVSRKNCLGVHNCNNWSRLKVFILKRKGHRHSQDSIANVTVVLFVIHQLNLECLWRSLFIKHIKSASAFVWGFSWLATLGSSKFSLKRALDQLFRANLKSSGDRNRLVSGNKDKSTCFADISRLIRILLTSN